MWLLGAGLSIGTIMGLTRGNWRGNQDYLCMLYLTLLLDSPFNHLTLLAQPFDSLDDRREGGGIPPPPILECLMSV